MAILEPSHRVVVNGQFYWASSPQRAALLRASPHSYSGPVRDPVTGQWFSPTQSSPRRVVDDAFFYFSTAASAGKFDRDPGRYLDRK
jgi:YHS domain-containing protein